MAIDSVAKLIEALRDSRLLDTAQMEAVAAMQATCGDPRAMMRDLIQRGWLTPFQINQIVQGLGKDLVLGGYRLMERLGQGGMGQVFKARHQALGKIVALKVIRKEHLEKPEAVHRFHREIRAVAQLSHPNIVMAYDADQVGDMHFFAMEYVDGIDLLHLVKQSGPLPVPLACEYMRQAALALQHAHERGLVHRDVKPANLLVSRGTLKANLDPNDPSSVSSWTSATCIKVLDMGLARIVSAEDTTNSVSWKTQDGKVLGTPDYIAPEQALKSSAADIRADLYSLGCTFYYILAGKVPFPGGTMMEKLLKHRMEEPMPLEQVRPGVPPAVGAIVRKLMAKKPDSRYQTPKEAAAALEAIMRPGAMLQAPAPVANAVPTAPGSPKSAPVATLAQPAPLAILVSGGTVVDAKVPMAIPLSAAIPASNGALARLRLPGTLTPKSKRVALAVGAVLVVGLIMLITLLSRSSAPKTKEKLTPAEENALTKTLDGVIAKTGDPKADVDKVRQELLQFRLEHPGTAQAQRAAVELERLASLLARMKPTTLADDERPLALTSGDLAGILGEHRQRHWGAVLCVSYSPDGAWIASGGADGYIRIWEANSMRQRARLVGHTGRIIALTYADRGKALVSASADGSVRLWRDLDSDKPREEAVLRNLGNFAHSVACSADDKALAYSGGDGSIFTVDLARPTTPKLRTRLSNATATSIAYAPANRYLAAVCTDHFVRLWDLDDDSALPTQLVHNGAVRTVVFSADGKTMAIAMNQSVVVWDIVKDPRRTAEILCHVGDVYSLAFSPTNHRLLAVGGAAGVVQLLNLDAPARRADNAVLLSGHTSAVNAVAFAPDGRTVVSGSQDGTVRTWAVSGTKPIERLALKSHTAAITSLAFNRDGSVLATAGNGDQTIRLWDYSDSAYQEAIVLRSAKSQPTAVAFTPDGKRLAGGFDRSIKLWDVAGGSARDLNEFSGHQQAIVGLAFTPDGKRLFSAATDNLLWTWSLSGGESNKIEMGWDDTLIALALSADGTTLATAGRNGALRFWDATVTPPKQRSTLQLSGEAKARIQTIAFAPDGLTLVVAGSDGPIRLIDLKAAKPREASPLDKHTRPVNALAYSPSGQSLASADDEGRVVVWSVHSDQPPREWHLPGSVRSLVFSPDGQFLATGNGNGTAYVLRLSTPK